MKVHANMKNDWYYDDTKNFSCPLSVNFMPPSNLEAALERIKPNIFVGKSSINTMELEECVYKILNKDRVLAIKIIEAIRASNAELVVVNTHPNIPSAYITGGKEVRGEFYGIVLKQSEIDARIVELYVPINLHVLQLYNSNVNSSENMRVNTILI